MTHTIKASVHLRSFFKETTDRPQSSLQVEVRLVSLLPPHGNLPSGEIVWPLVKGPLWLRVIFIAESQLLTNPALSNKAEHYSPAGGTGLHIPVSTTAADIVQTRT